MFRRFAAIAYAVLMLSIAIGAVVRIHNVTSRTLFSDETYSILRITGHMEAPLRALVDDRVRAFSAIAAFQEVDAHTSPGATLASIGTEEPQRGPLYYTLANLWLAVGGTSIAGFRSLAVIFGILTIAAAYLFGAVAFRDRLGGTILAALVALSPFHLAYARQAREYGLFSLIVFLSGAGLLHAMRRRSAVTWIAFAIACAVGLLTTPLFVFVLASFALYVAYAFVRESLDLRAVLSFIGALGASAIVVSPWYVYVARVSEKVAGQTAWGATVYPLKFYLAKIAFECGAVFFDAEFGNLTFAAALVFIFAAVVYLLIRAIRSGTDALIFAIALAVPTAFVLLVNDLHAGAHFATIARYATPVWIALEIVVTAGAVAGLRMAGRSAIASATAVGALVLGGLFCTLTDFAHRSWWDNNDNVPLQDVAAAVNARPGSIVLASQLPLTMVLEHYVNADARVQLYAEREIPALSPSGKPNMLFVPFPEVLHALAARSGGHVEAALTPSSTSVVGTFHTRLQHSSFSDPDAFDVNSDANALWVLP